MEHRVYTDPAEPGAPQPGDIVVVVTDGAPGVAWGIYTRLVGAVIRLVPPSDLPDDVRKAHAWAFEDRHSQDAVYAVRWPTPAELAAYQLSHGSQP